ncbi:GNAT family N-acetyltransferase [Hoyosella altamirensis]|uniref:GNAT family N-acetyltransferase n=1 Tax=Hoyosella altamirensis TaxID=616997 RepID=A0A839RHE4_9ACTN|nr:hypothetical protein [Hoyosella altamirensis]MBB3035596.1 hypothetical protein [Hoyosella altamirensis]
MEPVEINAGEWYLRALRCDERVDDSPALRAHGVTDPARYVRTCTAEWSADTRYTWAVCEPSTGEMLGEVSLHPGERSAVVETWHRAGQEAAVATSREAVIRFCEAGLGLSISDTN